MNFGALSYLVKSPGVVTGGHQSKTGEKREVLGVEVGGGFLLWK